MQKGQVELFVSGRDALWMSLGCSVGLKIRTHLTIGGHHSATIAENEIKASKLRALCTTS